MPELLTRLALRGSRRTGDPEGSGGSILVEVSFVAIVALLVVARPADPAHSGQDQSLGLSAR